MPVTRWSLGVAGLLLLFALWRVVAVGRKQRPTVLERQRATWGGMPKAYQQTQAGHVWKLRIARRGHERRKRA